MLALTFQVGPHRAALDIRRVTEVVPRVRLQPLAGGPAWLAGVFVYRGQVVPVIDLYRLAGAGECPPHLSSRIILVPYQGGRLLGLLASHVADLREVPTTTGGLSGLTEAGRPDLGPVLADGGDVLSLLDLDRLLPNTMQQQLAELPA